MTITLFGGSFNPPHLGHGLIIQEFLSSKPDRTIWLMPTYNHTFGKDLAPSTHRIEMTQHLIDHLSQTQKSLTDRISLCPIEIDFKLSGQTFQTLSMLETEKEYLTKIMKLTESPTFEFLMGSDQLGSFHKWGNWERLLEKMTFWVYPRQGYDMAPLQHNMKPFIQENQTITNFSSTLIRNRINTQTNTQLLLPGKISQYITDNKLYQ